MVSDALLNLLLVAPPRVGNPRPFTFATLSPRRTKRRGGGGGVGPDRIWGGEARAAMPPKLMALPLQLEAEAEVTPTRPPKRDGKMPGGRARGVAGSVGATNLRLVEAEVPEAAVMPLEWVHVELVAGFPRSVEAGSRGEGYTVVPAA